MTEKEIFINDIKEILRKKPFRDEKWVEVFAHDVWYVKDYLKGYFTADMRRKNNDKGRKTDSRH